MTPSQFQISQLRQDKIIYALEAVAFNTASILAIIIIMYLRLPQIYILIVAGYSLLYTLYMGLTNLDRLKKIKKLEKSLK